MQAYADRVESLHPGCSLASFELKGVMLDIAAAGAGVAEAAGEVKPLVSRVFIPAHGHDAMIFIFLLCMPIHSPFLLRSPWPTAESINIDLCPSPFPQIIIPQLHPSPRQVPLLPLFHVHVVPPPNAYVLLVHTPFIPRAGARPLPGPLITTRGHRITGGRGGRLLHTGER